MPRKVGLYVPKGASRKGKAASRKEKGEEPSELVQAASVETQTDDLPPTQLTSVSAQTDIVEYKDVAIQTDDDMCVTGDVQEEQEEEELALCEGNPDEKFIPLVVKHKGVFRDVTGIIKFFCQ